MAHTFVLLSDNRLKLLKTHYHTIIHTWLKRWFMLEQFTLDTTAIKAATLLDQSFVLNQVIFNPSEESKIFHAVFDHQPTNNDKIKLFCEHVADDLYQVIFNNNQKSNSNDMTSANPPLDDCLQLTIKARTCFGHFSFSIYLSSVHFYALLPLSTAANSALTKLTHAMTDCEITIDATLDPIHMTLKQIKNLDIGDVIATEHHFDSPVTLKINSTNELKAKLIADNGYKALSLLNS
ncbi:FliM/FliN family flagellar motor C-terminal domain-containing protein [Cysteiniphilum sp. QT6929]|uniref:FliM/FliN family flagellar motor C-terminal domain-containing protein n=1 Tax=Cysteiniphilum sp. QT6929 TaxID=2975055 RepID=UPI0024B32846|nr:FliM/FliN family flagellar motor C-terminal domain-containing protein [Cysteiniphilum sp. QT6929]WHN66105.1 FliM/FliN family flagellar motor C-terminal domain-containing protein [Cysteiniphilum sp. QT6929]